MMQWMKPFWNELPGDCYLIKHCPVRLKHLNYCSIYEYLKLFFNILLVIRLCFVIFLKNISV